MKTKIRLEDINKTDPFKVPENYFEQFNEEIMKRLPAIKMPEFKPVPLREKVKPWIYLAAMFVGLFFAIQFLTKNARNQSTYSSSSGFEIQSTAIQPDKYWSTVEISEEEFYQYLEEQLTEDEYYDYLYDEFYSMQNM